LADSFSSHRLYSFGPFELDPARRLLLRDGEPIPLTPKAFDTLVILVERHAQVMTKDDLLQLLWPDVVVEESNLSQQISHLRKALDDEATEPRYIATLPKRGYRFVSPVAQKEAAAPWRVAQRIVRAHVVVPALAVVLLAAIAAAMVMMRPQPPQGDLVRFAIEPPAGARFSFLALSPDGGRLVFSARDSHNEDQLWIRPLDALESRALPGTEGGVTPFWSPDGRHVGFFAHGKLKTIDVLGGPPETLCDAPNPRGGSWNRDGVIVFAPDSRSALLQIRATGGSPAPATYLDPAIRAGSHRFPQFLPDGRHFLYLLWSGQVEKQGVWVGSIDSRETRRLLDANSSAAYAPPGYLLFVRDENLMAQSFDVGRLTLSGHALSVANGLGRRTNNYAAFSVSERGSLAYHAVDFKMRLAWFDRSGREVEPLAMRPARINDPVVSPDGHQILFVRADPETETTDIFLYDNSRAVVSRVTTDPGVDVLPVWSPDAKRVAFRSNRNGAGDIYVKSVNGGTDELLLRNAARKDPTDWSPDGKFILYDNYDGSDASRESDMWVLPLFGDRNPHPYQRTTFSAWGGRFSPDGRWVAYAADEHSKNGDVYIQAFPATGVSYRVSTRGGWQPSWRRDGRELFYLATDGTLMAAAVWDHDGMLEVAAPTPLFRRTWRSTLLRNHYDVAPNGDRFLINAPVQDETTAPVTFVLNWTAMLGK
jgi:DNA-binding winged helix-turn-helix (wHTH) protein/Tol biopolymer transport system component